VREAVKHYFREAAQAVEKRVADTSAPSERVVVYLNAVAERLRPLSRQFLDDMARFEPAREVYEANTRLAAARIRLLIADVVGPDVIMWSCTIFHKPPEKGKRTPFHRDGEFWPLDPLATATLWIAVTESNAANGCLRLVPGSHRAQDIGSHHDVASDDVVFGREIDHDQFDPATAVDIELEPGQMVLFDVRMIHGANPNEGARPRSALTARYMPGTVRFRHDTARTATVKEDGFALATRPLFLLRGEDRAGNDFSANADAADRAALQAWL